MCCTMQARLHNFKDISILTEINHRFFQQASVNVMPCTVFKSINCRWGAAKCSDAPTFLYLCACCCCWNFPNRARRPDSDAKSEIKRPQRQRRNRLTIIDCHKCHLLSACERGVGNMLRDTPLNDEQQAPSNCLPTLNGPHDSNKRRPDLIRRPKCPWTPPPPCPPMSF